jgi:hypothetical protein
MVSTGTPPTSHTVIKLNRGMFQIKHTNKSNNLQGKETTCNNGWSWCKSRVQETYNSVKQVAALSHIWKTQKHS